MGTKYNFKIPSKSFDKLYQRTSVVTIGKELFLRSGNQLTSCFISGILSLEGMDIFRMDRRCHRMFYCIYIYNDMFFLSFEKLF
ncbi:hypothetical protein T231_13435 [Tannerella sp. oral taxon BU063 isolate Cell 6/7/9]|uniref:Uncharacterized protein n=3 Tax=Tannerella serpentiformis TaxID=712710 RepID=W2CTT1_9BACT|nr:hypothetical protein T231_13435 [Tannerella sp. oral taxon BU063 isolate Cell 6/7/9]ETK10463.1 hypothetical protein T230_02345 [Tannerella sp. oral taxon BU063 isolate Cell 1/3]ETK12086.1 hypothetical protein T235_11925 [Tannerella sp. oral taxon BU063 isolate Cell 8/11]